VSKYSLHGFTELSSGDEKVTRKPDPPRGFQAAVEARNRREDDPRGWIMRQIDRLVRKQAEPSPAPEPTPAVETTSRRREVLPTERGLQYDERIGWHIPCSLSREELASTVPSKDLLRRMRASR
jgi:hypothetical protein